MRALALIAQHGNAPTLANRDVPQWAPIREEFLVP
jgi:hypothetical protein